MTSGRQQPIATPITMSNGTRLVPRQSNSQQPTDSNASQQDQQDPSATPGAVASTTSQNPDRSPPLSLQDEWHRRWGNLQPGTSIIRIQGNTITAGNSMKVVNSGTRIATIDVERNQLKSPNISCTARGDAVGINFGLAESEGSDRGNHVDVEQEFVVRSEVNGRVEQYTSRGPGGFGSQLPTNEAGPSN